MDRTVNMLVHPMYVEELLDLVGLRKMGHVQHMIQGHEYGQSSTKSTQWMEMHNR